MSLDFTADPSDAARRPEADGTAFAPTPIYARPTRKARGRPAAGGASARSPSPKAWAALAAIPVGLIVVGAAAYYITRPSPQGAPQMTPGAPEMAAADSVTPAPAAPAAPPPAQANAAAPAGPAPAAATSPAANSAPPRAPTPATRRERPRMAQAAPSRAPSAADTGQDASAVLPAAPQRYAPSGTSVNPPTLVVPPAAVTIPTPSPSTSTAPAEPVAPEATTATP